MLNRFITYVTEGSIFTSLEISELAGKLTYYVLVVKKQHGELNILNAESSEQLSSLKGYFKKNTPTFLIINTSKVLTKQIDNTDSSSPEAIVNHVFPNLNLSSFYYEIIQEKANPVISISKKEYVEETLNKLKVSDISISGITLGITSIIATLPYFAEEEIITSKNEINLTSQSITKVNSLSERKTKKYTINGIDLESPYLLPFSQILGHLEHVQTIGNFGNYNSELFSNVSNGRIFDKISKVALFSFLALLLLNFLVFDYYRDAVESQTSNMEISTSQNQQLKKMSGSILKKQKRLEALTSSSNSKSSLYLDLLAKDIPLTILLNEITYQPLKKPLRENKPIELELRNMTVSGISKNSEEFSKWIEELEKQEWILSVETMDYDFLQGESSNFSIKIDINED
ncbi:hypothetical protein D9V96_020515 [Zobellia laminariae]|uniref:hypothetical protein n=1 Tax=Zobellia laminariae TaxID=248906 RepID=UPI0012D9044E|nr:hypothetical protein [Zobellia laminariae]